MKQFLFCLIIGSLMITFNFACAAPFLVCDKPLPNEQVIKYIGKVDGQPFETFYAIHTSGAAIIYDMKSLDLTTVHNFSDIKACNDVGCSTPAVSFTSPKVPFSPLNLKFLN